MGEEMMGKKGIKERRGKLLEHEHHSRRDWRRAEIEGSGVEGFGWIRRLQNQSRRKKNRRGSEEGRAWVRLHLRSFLGLSWSEVEFRRWMKWVHPWHRT